ncbi:hypothetical protein TEHN7126_1578 [Tetragenococcus halophilus subsp. halophilus]|uniref:polysaccharide pyruvyl transferase family protein n=1 Tax=Tetragenococcus halophilus TaxID=51669 RepID=UPI000CB9A368|nr:polysaccharide pyruvyl transferase family protein [Tetragenococcus halophilus]GBD73070.1 hypothetical protein TEHN7125_1230 [Tetragenococcus halophilus subsp. halophilus]GBD75879.1 hypothetical protein TEHN7126_1578 [Tetragenococcus halophilus subsp. halophilus]
MKIGLIGLPYDDNLGDLVMIESLEKIIKQRLKINAEFIRIDLLARNLKKGVSYRNYIFKKTVGFFEKFINEKVAQALNIRRFNYFERDEVKKHFKNQLKNCDIAIIVGGGIINFRTNRFVNHFSSIIDCLEELNIPCILNSLGVEQGYDLNFPNCRIYEQALNNKQLQAISTRDNLHTLREYVCNNEKTTLVSDSACFVCDLDNIKEKKACSIGIGIIRPEIFDSYKMQDLKKSYLLIINNLIELLKQGNYQFQLFTNGNGQDFAFGQTLLEKHNLNADFLAGKPKSSKQLEVNIASYEKIICSRLHAAIIAYSADVPVMGIDWNGKLKSFGEQIYTQSLFYFPDEVTAEQLLEILNSINDYKWTQKNKREYLEKELNFLKSNLELLIE